MVVVIIKCEFEEINVPWELFRGVSMVGVNREFPSIPSPRFLFR